LGQKEIWGDMYECPIDVLEWLPTQIGGGYGMYGTAAIKLPSGFYKLIDMWMRLHSSMGAK
jgi:hypothetical protein